jgi:hypothetical protein
MGEIMDKIIKTALGLFIIILVIFVTLVSYSAYITMTYRNSLTSTYEYTCTISTDDVLSNVTFFFPVPADVNGNSPVVTQISKQVVSGVPAGWNLTLYDTGKATLLKVSARTVGQSAINVSVQPTTITFSVNVSSPVLIDTASPVDHAAVFRPIQSIHAASCPAGDSTSATSTPACYQYLTSIYADYTTASGTTVTISASVTGTNSWTIFSPASNEYRNTIGMLTLHGGNHGWVTTLCWIESGLGSYDAPTL